MPLSPTRTYATEVEAAAYLAERGLVIPSGEAAMSVLLLNAMDWLGIQNWKGTPTDPAQELQWPRDEVYINGVSIDSVTVPVRIKNAQIMLAYYSTQLALFPTVAAGLPGPVIQKTIPGAVSITYASPGAGGASRVPFMPQITALISDYLSTSGIGPLNLLAVRS